MTDHQFDRRRLLHAGLLTGAAVSTSALTTLTPTSDARAATPPRPTDGSSINQRADRRFAALEARTGKRLGVCARDHRTGATLAWRADELFPMCSVFKTLAVAAVLRGELITPDAAVLTRPVHVPPVAVLPNSPVVAEAVRTGVPATVEQLCVGTLQFSDNSAANELMARIGGPTAITALARRLGDEVTRLDRWETELNSAEPERFTDTTSPRAIAETFTALLLGDGLPEVGRRRLTTWMLGNQTSDERLRRALPPRWTLADKTGGGSYGVNNDVGVAYGPQRRAITIAVLSRSDTDAEAPARDDLVRRAGEVCFELLT